MTNDQSNNIYNVLEQWYDSSGGNSPEFNDSTTVPYYGPIDKWQTSLVTDMNNLFSTANNAQSSSFNENIMFWDVSNVTNMSGMFEGAAIFNQDISKWKTGLVTTMANMFRNASSFNQNIATWDISKVLFMNGMFYNATSFNQSISIWAITNNQINFSNMFYNATDMSNNYAAPVTPTIDYFNKGEPIPNNETLVTLCQIYSIDPESPMFTNNKVKPYYSSIENWNITQCTSMKNLFMETTFNEDISNWDTSNITDILKLVQRKQCFQSRHKQLGYFQCNKYVIYVL